MGIEALFVAPFSATRPLRARAAEHAVAQARR